MIVCTVFTSEATLLQHTNTATPVVADSVKYEYQILYSYDS